MALTSAQIETVREIALLKSLATATSLCGSLTAAQETSLINIVDVVWPKVRFKIGHLVPNRRDILNSRIEERRQIRHTVRLMLGLDPVSQEEIDMAELDGTYGAVIGGVGGGKGGASTGRGEFGVFTVSGIGNRNNSNENDSELA